MTTAETDLNFEELVEEEAQAAPADDAITLPKLKLEDLWDYREQLRREIAQLSESRGRADRELQNRLHEANPAFFEEGASGSATLAGGSLVLSGTWAKTYQYHEEVIRDELMQLVADNPEAPTLTEAEFSELVKWEADVKGVVFNKLVKRGGRLAEVLNRMRSLKSQRLDFKPAERVI